MNNASTMSRLPGFTQCAYRTGRVLLPAGLPEASLPRVRGRPAKIKANSHVLPSVMAAARQDRESVRRRRRKPEEKKSHLRNKKKKL